MNTVRRSYFLQIATVCFAILLSYTARMAASVGEARPGTVPCQSKAAAESPTAQKKLAQRIVKSIRPGTAPSDPSLFLSALLATGLHCTNCGRPMQAFQAAADIGQPAPQNFPFVLRV